MLQALTYHPEENPGRFERLGPQPIPATTLNDDVLLHANAGVLDVLFLINQGSSESPTALAGDSPIESAFTVFVRTIVGFCTHA